VAEDAAVACVATNRDVAASPPSPFQERDLIVSSRVERCIDYVAAHEVRFALPVDSQRRQALGGVGGESVCRRTL